jgi:hypothetical protein
VYLQDFKECCEDARDNYWTEATGCCNAFDGNDCCADKMDTWDPVTHTCKPPCPCEGCCDFNCCDELDYFMHRAYEEHYQFEDNLGSFEDFYASWYTEFYTWWNTGVEQ